MSMTKGIAALMAVVLAFALLLDQVMPHEARTPERVVSSAIAKVEKREQLLHSNDRPVELANEMKLRAESNVTAVQPGSQLVTLITGKGMACARVTGVLPVRAGDGIYAITCDVGSAYRRYIVDTRQGSVQTS